jgi:hypothetical protein
MKFGFRKAWKLISRDIKECRMYLSNKECLNRKDNGRGYLMKH